MGHEPDVARRLAGMIPEARFGYKAYSNPVSWACQRWARLEIRDANMGPDRVAFGGFEELLLLLRLATSSYLSGANNQSWSGSVEDWIVGGVWVNNGSRVNQRSI